MISFLPTNTKVKIELADSTLIENLTVNGNNFVSDTPISNDIFEDNLSKIKVITPDDTIEFQDIKLIQNRQFGDKYMFVLAEKTQEEKEKEELLQVLADLAELTLEVLGSD